MTARLNRPAMFFACTSLFLAVALAWSWAPRFAQQGADVPYDEDIAFPHKQFLNTEAYVAANGTLTADWVGYKNNTFSILCLPEECIIADVAQIGAKQISSINGPVVYPVLRWTKEEVVAQDKGLCARITITLQRQLVAKLKRYGHDTERSSFFSAAAARDTWPRSACARPRAAPWQ
jgi:hypothetical protein